MIELYQAEWCPFSAKVREALTELNVDFVARQVPPAMKDRDALEEATGRRDIPVVVLEDGTILAGEDDELITALEERFPPGPWADGHREKHRMHQ